MTVHEAPEKTREGDYDANHDLDANHSVCSNVWGIDTDPGNEINLFTLQPFVNYNFDKGWYLTTSPIMTHNAETPSGQRWTVPLGGGMGRVFRIGTQAVNAQGHVYYNIEKPDIPGDWTVRLQFQLMFPR
ncbi:MAG: hypothetical protein QNK37_30465 [Acidobacteriota bacterium]|nr:hypothetical protein [Acidobacteriota bacterium]